MLEPHFLPLTGKELNETLAKVPELVENLPAPSESLRGKFLLTPNGDTDALYVCMRINGSSTWAKFVPQIDPVSKNVYLVDLHGTNLKTADGMYLAVNE